MNKDSILKCLDAWWNSEKDGLALKIGSELSEKEPDRPSVETPMPESKPRLTIVDGPKMPTQGKFEAGGPRGAVIHFTSGRYDRGVQSAFEVAEYGITQGHAYWLIARDGTVVKTHEANEWGWHAGNSYWPSLGFSVSSKTIGIELLSAGRLNMKLESWFGTTVPAMETRSITSARYKGEQTGTYHAYTSAQEDALFELLKYLRKTFPNTFRYENVVGHDECCQPSGRKDDPGGALSMGMPELRRRLSNS